MAGEGGDILTERNTLHDNFVFKSPTTLFVKANFSSPPYNDIRDALIQPRKFGKHSKIITSFVTGKLLALGKQIGFATRFGLEKENKDSWTAPP